LSSDVATHWFRDQFLNSYTLGVSLEHKSEAVSLDIDTSNAAVTNEGSETSQREEKKL
jgi:hypothetical protein